MKSLIPYKVNLNINSVKSYQDRLLRVDSVNPRGLKIAVSYDMGAFAGKRSCLWLSYGFLAFLINTDSISCGSLIVW